MRLGHPSRPLEQLFPRAPLQFLQRLLPHAPSPRASHTHTLFDASFTPSLFAGHGRLGIGKSLTLGNITMRLALVKFGGTQAAFRELSKEERREFCALVRVAAKAEFEAQGGGGGGGGGGR